MLSRLMLLPGGETQPAQFTPGSLRGWKTSQASGVLLHGVSPGVPASQAPHRPGAIVVAIAGNLG